MFPSAHTSPSTLRRSLTQVTEREVGVAENFVTSLEERAAAMERDAGAMRKLVEAARELGEDRGREAVRLIVRERPGIWALVDLRAEMKRRGWFTSNKGVDVAVSRLVGSGEARHVGKGRYEFSDSNGKEGVIESPASGVA